MATDKSSVPMPLPVLTNSAQSAEPTQPTPRERAYGLQYLWLLGQRSSYIDPDHLRKGAYIGLLASEGADENTAHDLAMEAARSHRGLSTAKPMDLELERFATWLSWVSQSLSIDGERALVAAATGAATARETGDQVAAAGAVQAAAGLRLYRFTPPDPERARSVSDSWAGRRSAAIVVGGLATAGVGATGAALHHVDWPVGVGLVFAGLALATLIPAVTRYQQTQFRPDYFCFEGPVRLVQEKSEEDRYRIHLGMLNAEVDELAARRLMESQDRIGRLYYHISSFGGIVGVTILRAETASGEGLYGTMVLPEVVG